MAWPKSCESWSESGVSRSAEVAKSRSKGCTERSDGSDLIWWKKVIECLTFFYRELNESSLIDEEISAEWKNEFFIPSVPSALSKIIIVSAI